MSAVNLTQSEFARTSDNTRIIIANFRSTTLLYEDRHPLYVLVLDVVVTSVMLSLRLE